MAEIELIHNIGNMIFTYLRRDLWENYVNYFKENNIDFTVIKETELVNKTRLIFITFEKETAFWDWSDKLQADNPLRKK